MGALLRYLAELGIVVEANDPKSLSEHEAVTRQLEFFADFVADPLAIQARLSRAHVLVVGVGTIGGAILEHLARAGLGRATAIDADVVSISNLARQGMFCLTDVGRPKVEAIAERLSKVSSTRFVGLRNSLDSAEQLVSLLDDVQLVINCADQPSVGQTSQWVGRACMLAGTPHILAGGYRTHLGFMGPTIIPGQTACWRCFEEHYRLKDPFGKIGWKPLKVAPATGGSFGPLASVVSGIHAWEAVRVLTGLLPPVLANRKAEIDFTTLKVDWIDVPPLENCRECASSRLRMSQATP